MHKVDYLSLFEKKRGEGYKQRQLQKFFQGGRGQAKYPLSTGSNKSLQLQLGIW